MKMPLTENKKIYLFIITIFSVLFAVSVAIFLPMSAQAEENGAWDIVTFDDTIYAPKNLKFDYQFKYKLSVTIDGAEQYREITNTLTSDDTPSTTGNGYNSWFNEFNFKDFEASQSFSFSKAGKYNATLTRSFNNTEGTTSTVDLTSCGAFNRTDLYSKFTETYNLTLYVNNQNKITDIIVWNSDTDPSGKTDPGSYKTSAQYKGYFVFPGGNLVLNFQKPESKFAEASTIRYRIEFFDMSRLDRKCESKTITANIAGSSPAQTIDFTFAENNCRSVKELDIQPGTVLEFPDKMVNIGTSYNITSSVSKTDYYYIASAKTSITNLDDHKPYSFTDVEWPKSSVFSVLYGVDLPNGKPNKATIVGPTETDGSNSNWCSVRFDYSEITPTGFMINNSPYFALIVIPAGLICAWFVYRRKKNLSRA